MNLNLPMPVRILVIDDDKDYVKNTLENHVKLLKMRNKMQILLDHALSAEEGKELYKKNEECDHYNGVIIDYWGVRDKGGTKEESGAFIELVTHFARERIEKAVITGHKSKQKEVEELCKGNFNLYFKDSSDRGEERMLLDLWDKIQNSEQAKILNKYSEIFRVLHDYFDEEANEKNRDRLVKCIQYMDNPDLVIIEDNLGRLRKIQEDIYRELNKKNPGLVSTDNLSPTLDFHEIMNGLYEKMLPKGEIISEFSWLLRKIPNRYGAHTKDAKYKETPSKYTVHSAAYALLDLFLWFREVVDKTR